MKDDMLIERKPGYRIYYGDGRYFVDTYKRVSCSYDSIEGALEAVYYAELRENTEMTDEIADKVRKIEREQGIVHLDAKQVMRILDDLDSYRRKHGRQVNVDNAMRVAEAIVARVAGFEDRNEWCDLLKSDPESKYAKDYADPSITF